MSLISAKWKRYNANSRDKNVGDCVKRSLSFAYGVDYDEISRILNRIKNEINAPAFNSHQTFNKFLLDNGATLLNNSYLNVTEDEFCKENPRGVYVLLTGPADKRYTSHMVCIMNGDIIDSWDSSDYVVRKGWKVNNVSLDIESVSWEDALDPIVDYIDAYMEDVNRKYNDWFRVWKGNHTILNDQTCKMMFLVETKDLPEDSEFRANQQYGKYITLKLNPRMSLDKNIESLQTKLKQRLYNWIYQFQKDKRDTLAIRDLELNSYFWNSREDKVNLLKLPKWSHKYVREFTDWSSIDRGIYDKYEVIMDALLGDPDREWEPSITFRSDSLREIKSQMNHYKNYYERPDLY